MADQFDAVTMATILDLVSDLIYRDKMALALDELRDMLEDLINNNQHFQFFWNNNRFKPETVAFINRIRFDLDVADAWNFFVFNTVPHTSPAEIDMNCFHVLHGVCDYIHNNILGDLFDDALGIWGNELSDVTEYLNMRLARGD